jgi:hypothetical protein
METIRSFVFSFDLRDANNQLPKIWWSCCAKIMESCVSLPGQAGSNELFATNRGTSRTRTQCRTHHQIVMPRSRARVSPSVCQIREVAGICIGCYASADPKTEPGHCETKSYARGISWPLSRTSLKKGLCHKMLGTPSNHRSHTRE